MAWLRLSGEQEIKQWVHVKLHTEPDTWNQTVSRPVMGTVGKEALSGDMTSDMIQDGFQVPDPVPQQEGAGTAVTLGPDQVEARLAGFEVLEARHRKGQAIRGPVQDGMQA